MPVSIPSLPSPVMSVRPAVVWVGRVLGAWWLSLVYVGWCSRFVTGSRGAGGSNVAACEVMSGWWGEEEVSWRSSRRRKREEWLGKERTERKR